MNCASRKNAKMSISETSRPHEKTNKKTSAEKREMEETTNHIHEDGPVEKVVPVIEIEEIGESTDDVLASEERAAENREAQDSNNEQEDDANDSDGSDHIDETKAEMVNRSEHDDGVNLSFGEKLREKMKLEEASQSKHSSSVKFVIEDEDEDDEESASNQGDDSFSEFVNRMSTSDGLGACSDQAENNDIQVSEQLFVQYLKRQETKHVKSTLRAAAWHPKHEIRGKLWYQICHHLHKADDMDIFVDFMEELFPNGWL